MNKEIEAAEMVRDATDLLNRAIALSRRAQAAGRDAGTINFQCLKVVAMAEQFQKRVSA